MTDDLVARAEAMYLPPSERDGSLVVGLLDIFPEMIAEIKRLRSEVARINQLREHEMDKIAKQGGLYEQYSAAKDARIAELETLKKLEAVEADHEYQKRLEEAFLKSIVPPEGYDSECNCGICKARRKKARAALEKIKAGGSIE